MHLLLHLSTLLLPFLFSPTTTATCTTFTQSGSAYHTDAYTQNQTVSPALTCTLNSTSYDQCGYVLPNSNLTANGCVLDGSGTFSATGTTNLSLSAADTAFLYPLVNGSADFSAVYVPGEGFSQSVIGCATKLYGCLGVGQSAYMQAWPNLLCVNGTVSGCADNSTIANDTPIAVCGVRSIESSMGGSSTVTPAWGYSTVNVSVEDVAGMATNPADNATCTKYYASAGVRIGGVKLGLVVAVGVMVVAFVV